MDDQPNKVEFSTVAEFVSQMGDFKTFRVYPTWVLSGEDAYILKGDREEVVMVPHDWMDRCDELRRFQISPEEFYQFLGRFIERFSELVKTLVDVLERLGRLEEEERTKMIDPCKAKLENDLREWRNVDKQLLNARARKKDFEDYILRLEVKAKGLSESIEKHFGEGEKVKFVILSGELFEIRACGLGQDSTLIKRHSVTGNP